jgi:hypothetical protein
MVNLEIADLELEEEEKDLERDNMFVPIDVFLKRRIGEVYSPFDNYDDVEMITPIEW